MQAVRQGRTWQGTGTWQQSPNASEKICYFPGRLLFLMHLCYFSCDLFGGIEKFRIFANDKGISISTITPSLKNNL